MNFYKISVRNHFIFLIAFLVLTVIFLFLINYVQAKIIYVDDEGGADYTKIQDAINEGKEGDTVYVYAGNYTEQININKTINLTGERRDNLNTKIEKSENVIRIKADWVNISGFIVNGVGDLGTYYGIIIESNNNKIFNCTILKSYRGINLQNSENNSIFNNNISYNREGIEVDDGCDNNTISNSSFYMNGSDIILHEGSNNNEISNNICSNSRGSSMLIHSKNNIISYNICYNGGTGISLYSPNYQNNIVSNNIFYNNKYGVWITSQSNYIIDNTCYNNEYGILLIESKYDIYVYKSKNNTIINNNCSYNQYGIWLDHSSNNIISNNKCSKNQKGIILEYSNNNTFTRNLILDNTNFGVELKKNSINNTIYHNTFVENNNSTSTYNSSRIQAKDSCTNNYWYNKILSEGNHWSDWIKPDKNNDGIVDEPYFINGSALSKDIYPFVYSFENLKKGVAYIDSISPNPALFDESIYFKGHGITFESKIKRYFWHSNIDGEFFNGTESNLSISILSRGVHNITFMVLTDFGFGSTQAFEILTIHEKPIAYIEKVSPNPAIEGVKIEFTGHGTDDGIISQFLWESDIDGFLSSKESFSLSNLSIGNHTITFKVKDNFGIWSVLVTKKLEVKEKIEKPKLIPKLKIPITKIYVGEIIILDASESIGDISAYFFDFGDNTNSGWISNSSIKYNYSKSGIYIVKLKVKDFNGNESYYDVVELTVEKNEVRQKSEKKLLVGIILVILLTIILIGAFMINRKSKLKYPQNQLSQRPYPPESRKQTETKIDDEFLKI